MTATVESKNYFSQWCLVSSLVVASVAPPEWGTVFLSTMLLIAILRFPPGYGNGLWRLIAPLLVLFFLGLLNTVDHDVFDIGKDLWYLSKIILMLSLGYFLLAKIQDEQVLLRGLIIAATIAAGVQFFQLGDSVQTGADFSQAYRETPGNLVVPIALALLIAIGRTRLEISRSWYVFALLVCSLALALSFSRTLIVTLVIATVSLKGWVQFRKQKMLFPTIAIFVVIAAFSVLSQSGGTPNDLVLDEDLDLVTKFIRSITEISISDYDELQDIAYNWRGFESYRALTGYYEVGVFRQLVGQGFGALVDLGFYIPLGGDGSTWFRFIPTMHNGYMYVLTKFGAIGLICYIYFLGTITWGNRKHSIGGASDHTQTSNILKGLGLILFFTTLVVTGPFNKSALDSALILIGGLSVFLAKHPIQQLPPTGPN